MLKNYLYKGLQFQFEEREVPVGAVEIEHAEKNAEAEVKAVKPANKSRKAVKAK